ncbi:NERD domain-containing protein [Actinomadura flavalba]|uniref:NERD domain-containing protein n=1 Tax=Actinomadura flavalba TaxID=1120938 RepID=UPI00146CE9C5|nr:NERD domain-containing protein [Actinomadura flavalba]
MFGSSIYLRDRAAFTGGTPQAVYAELWQRDRRSRIRTRAIFAGLTLLLCGLLVNPVFGIVAALVVASLDFFFHWYGYQRSSVWRRGLRGDQRTNRLLRHTLERRGHRTLHARMVPGHGVVDQIVIGPGGVWLLHNDAWHPETEIEKHGGKIFIDGRTPSKLIGGTHDTAKEIARVLSAHAGRDVSVTPVMIVHGGQIKHTPFVADGIVFTTPLRLPRWIRRNPTADLSSDDVENLLRVAVHRLPIGGRTMTAA